MEDRLTNSSSTLRHQWLRIIPRLEAVRSGFHGLDDVPPNNVTYIVIQIPLLLHEISRQLLASRIHVGPRNIISLDLCHIRRSVPCLPIL